ncbi:MAG TPA: hypothetical protein ENG62_01140 [Thermoplasmatales archaeon]|nr:hypothetical protein [Thermoplasmatales archaeon]
MHITRILFQADDETYYGIFEVTERATLKLEYREDSYPTEFTDKALTFVARSQLQPRLEVREIIRIYFNHKTGLFNLLNLLEA